MSITKLDKPLVIGGKAVYPQTSADQVVMSDGKTLNEIIENIGSSSSSGGNVSINFDGTEETGEVVPINADALGGHNAGYYATKTEVNTAQATADNAIARLDNMGMELVWENASPTSEFAAQTVNCDWTQAETVTILCDSATSLTGACSLTLKPSLNKKGSLSYAFYDGGAHIRAREFTFVNGGVSFAAAKGDGSTGNLYMIPTHIYINK